jgi:peptidyl-tRNA hydrolase
MDRNPDPYMMYTVVRRSLNLTAGKACSQCQHAFDYLTRKVDTLKGTGGLYSESDRERLRNFREWRNSTDHAKIVLGASDEEFAQVKEENPQHFVVIDLGYTQVEPNTETCLSLWPMRKSARSPILTRLRPL